MHLKPKIGTNQRKYHASKNEQAGQGDKAQPDFAFSCKREAIADNPAHQKLFGDF
jgi:hypothetical protein